MIFNIFKSKHTLSEIIPEGFVDIHSHILPGVDDGAKDIKSSINLISQMIDLGFYKIIATPHTYKGVYDNTNEVIKKKFNELNNSIGNSIKLSYASEYYLDESFSKNCDSKSLLTLKENYVLVETSFISVPNNFYNLLFKMQMNNYVPILAHPERYLFLHNNFDEYIKIKRAGCYFQLNLLSLTGFYGEKINKIANKLIENNLIDFVGSDFHNQTHINIFKANKNVICSDVNKLQKAIENNNKFK